jgi:hypothetical protein
VIFGLGALEEERRALVERSRTLRAGIVEDLKPLSPGVAAAGVLRTALRWASRAALLYSLLRRR